MWIGRTRDRIFRRPSCPYAPERHPGRGMKAGGTHLLWGLFGTQNELFFKSGSLTIDAVKVLVFNEQLASNETFRAFIDNEIVRSDGSGFGVMLDLVNQGK